MDDWELPAIRLLIQALNSRISTDGAWMLPYLRLQSLYVYFQYAVTVVRIQEENLEKMEGGEHKNFESHAAYAESELRILSSSISAYAYMRTCLRLAKEVCATVADEALMKYRHEHSDWAKTLIEKRDLVQAHPDQEWALVWKRNMRASDGRVGFPVRNLNDPTRSRQIILTPRHDVERLRAYFEGLGAHLARIWRT